jgi:hypothetical protein
MSRATAWLVGLVLAALATSALATAALATSALARDAAATKRVSRADGKMSLALPKAWQTKVAVEPPFALAVDCKVAGN